MTSLLGICERLEPKEDWNVLPEEINGNALRLFREKQSINEHAWIMFPHRETRHYKRPCQPWHLLLTQQITVENDQATRHHLRSFVREMEMRQTLPSSRWANDDQSHQHDGDSRQQFPDQLMSVHVSLRSWWRFSCVIVELTEDWCQLQRAADRVGSIQWVTNRRSDSHRQTTQTWNPSMTIAVERRFRSFPFLIVWRTWIGISRTPSSLFMSPEHEGRKTSSSSSSSSLSIERESSSIRRQIKTGALQRKVTRAGSSSLFSSRVTLFVATSWLCSHAWHCCPAVWRFLVARATFTSLRSRSLRKADQMFEWFLSGCHDLK